MSSRHPKIAEATKQLGKLDPAMRARIVKALQRTFDTVHSDLAEAAGLGDGVAIQDVEVIREGAADYVHSYHRDDGAYEAWSELGWDARDVLLAEAFPG